MTNRDRFNFLSAKVRKDTEECGIKIDLNHPADRAILEECGLTREEAFELLSLFDTLFAEDDEWDDTRRVNLP